jgi:dihydrolipoamide dehydrogenase
MDKAMIVPGCTYCHPQVASVGLTEAKAKSRGRDIKVGRFPFVGNGKAIALGEPEGLVKTIFDKKTGELLGAHMVGAEVTELIQGFVVAMNLETTEEELMHTVFPHPTLSEMMHESVLDAYGLVTVLDTTTQKPARAIPKRRIGPIPKSSASRTGSACARRSRRAIWKPARS